jgi:hypothetical protein
LSQFAKQVDRHFAKKKRRGILAEARELIVRADHTTTTVQFSTEKGIVSITCFMNQVFFVWIYVNIPNRCNSVILFNYSMP